MICDHVYNDLKNFTSCVNQKEKPKDRCKVLVCHHNLMDSRDLRKDLDMEGIYQNLCLKRINEQALSLDQNDHQKPLQELVHGSVGAGSRNSYCETNKERGKNRSKGIIKV